MTTIIAAAAIGTWGYAAFLAQPGNRPQPAPAPATSPAPAATTSGATWGDLSAPSSTRPAAHAPTPPPPPAAPTLYRMADASGQVWEHPDQGQLRGFIEVRNRQAFVPFTYTAGSRCSTGRCR